MGILYFVIAQTDLHGIVTKIIILLLMENAAVL